MDDDFERRREMRRQKREEMRLEAERMAYRRNDEDEEEAARERRRRARQDRLRSKESEDASNPPESVELNNTHSVTVSETISTSVVSTAPSGEAEDEEQALLDRLAKREERRQRRMMEALDRQRDQESTDAPSYGMEEQSSIRRALYHDQEEESPAFNSRKQEKEQEKEEEPTQEEEEEPKQEEEEEKPRRSYLREQESIEEKSQIEEKANSEQDGARSSENCETSRLVLKAEAALEEAGVSEDVEEVEESELDRLKEITDQEHAETADSEHTEREVADILDLTEDEDLGRKSKQQNGGVYEDSKHKKAERTLSRGSLRSPETPSAEDPDGEGARLEAERKLEELKRRRDETESEEFERMRQKQQEAEAELEELRRKREERRKVLEEEERQKKQEEAERKSKEEDEKRRMKEEIERRRAEAAERRQKVGEEVDGDTGKPFKCVSPRGSSLKIGERAEFLNKSAQKSAVKTSHSPVVSKIDNRLEQYTTAVQSNKDARSPRAAAIDLPTVTDGVRSIKSMWEKGSVFSASHSSPTSNKDAAGIKVGVAGRINDWLNKTPETGKTSGGRPADLKPGDVTSKRSLWENKGSSASKVTSRGESKSFANGMGH